jgi:DNA-directed RNA polymerase specialized sigma24 family protein
MDRDAAISELPASYAVAIRLRGGGSDDHTIARALDIDEEAVGPLLAMAERKLAALIGARP